MRNRQPPVTEIPGPRSRERMARGTFDMQAFYRAMVIDDHRSEGTTLVDVDGNTYLDLFGNFALGGLGYNHPRLLATAQSPQFVRAMVNPTSTPFVPADTWIDVMDRLHELAAPSGMSRMYCVDAGGEGVDAAIKAAFLVHAEDQREGRGEPRNPLSLPQERIDAWMANAGTDAVIVSFEGAFHGRGLGPLSATHSKPIHKADMPAFPWPMVPFPALRWPLDRFEAENKAREGECLEALERVLESHHGKVAAILVEPIQCEGGDRHASASFFRQVQELAEEAGAALILDEVQTGMGVTGTLWAHEHFDLPEAPDLVCFGKKMQMGGFFAGPHWDVRQFGRMYQTRNGDRARAMLALTTLQVMREERLLDRVRRVGARFLAHLAALAERFPSLVGEPRGLGLLLAFDLPTPQLRDDFLKRCLRQGVFATYTGTRSVRLRPHLITTEAEADEAAEVFGRVLAEMER